MIKSYYKSGDTIALASNMAMRLNMPPFELGEAISSFIYALEKMLVQFGEADSLLSRSENLERLISYIVDENIQPHSRLLTDIRGTLWSKKEIRGLIQWLTSLENSVRQLAPNML